MALPVFKTGEAEQLGLAGSIPVRLRETYKRRCVMTADARRSVPRTDVVLADGRLAEAMTRLGRSTVKEAVAVAQQLARQGVLDPAEVADAAVAGLPETASSFHEVINATGVVLHTNLGRAPLSDAALRAIEAAAGYVDIEFDLATGRRAPR